MESLTLTMVVLSVILAAVAAGLQAYAAYRRRRLMDTMAGIAAGLPLGGLAAMIAEDMRRWMAGRAAKNAAFEESLRKTRSRLDEAVSAWKADVAALCRPGSELGGVADPFCACGRKKGEGYAQCRRCADAAR